MPPESPESVKVQGIFDVDVKNKPTKCFWFCGYVQFRLATPGAFCDLLFKICWHCLPQ